MAVTTTVQPKFAIKLIVIAIVCFVFGVWGLYDYFIHIPRKQQMYERWAVLDAAKTALETTRQSDALDERYETAINKTEAALEDLVRRRCEMLGIEYRPIDDPSNGPWWAMLLLHAADTPPEFPDETANQPAVKEAARIAESLREDSKAEKGRLARTLTVRPAEWTWFRNFFMIHEGLRIGRQNPAAEGQPLSGPAATAYEFVRTGLDQTGDVTPPSRFDHAMQWAFILCLPCAPYFIWVYVRTRRRKYTLEDDGSFRFPGGQWAREEIADIEMSRWMAKSVAYVVSRGDERVKLDDYIHKNTHLIVGALASDMYPDQWDAEAKPRKPTNDEELTEAVSGESPDDEDAAPAGGEPAESPVQAGDPAPDRS
jgi:hypothetical protein